ncbi:hypothetical protein FQA39_LY06371 [Lamprigera yunnana]|nr:hypothetical protein FQA39_LY06371 [Lamprigera yunnana]
MKIVLVFAALVVVTLASPLEQRGISEALTGVSADLEKVIKCATDAAQSTGTNIAPLLNSILNSFKSLEDIFKCPASSPTNVVTVLQGLITCVAQNGVGSIFGGAGGVLFGLLPLIMSLGTLTKCGVSSLIAAIKNAIMNLSV